MTENQFREEIDAIKDTLDNLSAVVASQGETAEIVLSAVGVNSEQIEALSELHASQEGEPTLFDMMFYIGEQLRIANLIALKKAWKPTHVEAREMKDTKILGAHLVVNQIDKQIMDFLNLNEVDTDATR